MPAFHATFSVGRVLAALLRALSLGLGRGLGPAGTLATVAPFGVVVAVAATLLLLRPEPAATHETEDTSGRSPRRVRVLAAPALMLMLCEGMANDWSALHLRDILDASPASAGVCGIGNIPCPTGEWLD